MTEQKEQPEKENIKEPMVLGFVARQDVNTELTFPQFFQLMLTVEELNKQLMQIKQTNFNNDSLRYYFESDVENVLDEQGNPVMIKNNKGDDVPSKTLRQDFWEPKVDTNTQSN